MTTGKEHTAEMNAFTLDVHLPPDFAAQALARDARDGLTAAPKSLPPKWFYDKVGSELFEDITRLPEYYPTRAEREILEAHAGDVAAASGCNRLLELGSGSSIKTRLLIDAMRAHGGLESYVALDVSEDALRDAGMSLVADYPDLAVHGLVADFSNQLALLPAGGGQLVAFLGSTIGNFEPASRAAFLTSLRSSLAPTDRFLLGADLVKSPDVLVAAYDDASGVTAAFNKNVLSVLNTGLGANFDLSAFDHVAVWDEDNEWIEMRLRSRRSQDVHVEALELDVHFHEGEEMRTEVSAKFRQAGLDAELTAAGFAPAGWWTDEAARFSLSLWQPSP
jgi:L-histidine Nalpha-methyltransferase